MYLMPKLDVIKTHDIDIGLKATISRKRKKKEPAPKKMRVSHLHPKSAPVSFSDDYVTNRMQMCITKMSFRTTKDLHIKNLVYIQKEGKGIDGKTPELYGSDEKEEYEKKMADKNWRIVISPQSNNIDLTVMTKTFMERLEKYTGHRFTWIAANHYDTNNHHTHVLINGIDKDGKNVEFLPKGSYPKIFADIAKEICTQMIGYKTKKQIENEKQKMTKLSRYTTLDKILEKYINGNILSPSYTNNTNAILLNERLEHLKELGLCSWDRQKGNFVFGENWNEELKKLGKYNMYYEGFKYAKCTRDKYSLHDPSKDGKIEGEVLHKYTMQKDSNNFALIIKKKDGSVSFVPLPFYPKDCFTGDEVSIETKEKRTYINNRNSKKG